MTPAKKTPPPDQPARDRISRDLGTTFLVEAGAGSGKTKSLVDRMIALLAAGRASIDTLAAVTFTRKAAAELRGRFQVALEQARLAEKDAEVRGRFDAALTGLERSFIGTIHSFCARLLRERPVEAGIDPEFRELEEHEDRVLLEKSWDEYQAKARLENEAALRGLDEAGLDPGDLEAAFKAIAEFPDVEPVPGRTGPPDFGAVRRDLEKLIDLASALVPRERPEKGRDPLQNLFIRLFRRRRNIGFTDGRRLMESVELFEKTLCCKKTYWAKKEDGLRLLAAAESFQEKVAGPAIREWREFRHTRALAFLGPAIRFYAEKRRAEARLNFQDQLMLSARLLRDNPEVRRYFRKRFHPILVDEFQDTDPIQAEILFLLTGTSDTEKDWTRLAPAPGSLFLVGDPKQSIYRFRRADIDIYNLVKDRIEASGGETLALSANFRSLRPIADWVDPLFDPRTGGAFPAAADAYQAGFHASRDGPRSRPRHAFRRAPDDRPRRAPQRQGGDHRDRLRARGRVHRLGPGRQPPPRRRGGRDAAGPARRLPRPLPLQGPDEQVRPAARGARHPLRDRRQRRLLRERRDQGGQEPPPGPRRPRRPRGHGGRAARSLLRAERPGPHRPPRRRRRILLPR